MTDLPSEPQSDLYVLCAGGHARVVIDILTMTGRKPKGLIDADPALHGSFVLDVPVLGGDAVILDLDPDAVALINALGNRPGHGQSNLSARRALFEKFKAKGYQFESVVSLDASISTSVDLEEGCHVITRAVIHPGCRLGANAILNTGASLDHDCIVGAHSHIAPWAVLCGGVSVGEECHVGARAVLVPGISVGDGAVVGAGAVVIDDVAPGLTVVGNPAHPVSPAAVSPSMVSPN